MHFHGNTDKDFFQWSGKWACNTCTAIYQVSRCRLVSYTNETSDDSSSSNFNVFTSKGSLLVQWTYGASASVAGSSPIIIKVRKGSLFVFAWPIKVKQFLYDVSILIEISTTRDSVIKQRIDGQMSVVLSANIIIVERAIQYHLFVNTVCQPFFRLQRRVIWCRKPFFMLIVTGYNPENPFGAITSQ